MENYSKHDKGSCKDTFGLDAPKSTGGSALTEAHSNLTTEDLRIHLNHVRARVTDHIWLC